ncbi:hypothetical protein [Hymenobacter sp. GOD-10R]|uniref:hypothetical protein n=1 Tax=Hymenobacter sp. GOD-10R TaxID=3093922 RepID=UPI002D79BE0E|nr:hypothetical protein [Hymenobacter sp. GOD-10R]WRQ29158.1 hypothetical protein SD425_02635 [Hymenobacter sp. GOD-10R]
MDFLVKHFYYLLLILLTGILSQFIVKTSDSTPAALAQLGFLFAVFQFLFVQLNNRQKKYFDLRYAFFKDVVKQLHAISDIIQQAMLLDVAPAETMNKLMSAANELSAAINANEKLLFPGLLSTPSARTINEQITALLNRTSAYHVSVSNDESEAHAVIESTNWHNETRIILKQFNKDKYTFFNTIRGYL